MRAALRPLFRASNVVDESVSDIRERIRAFSEEKELACGARAEEHRRVYLFWLTFGRVVGVLATVLAAVVAISLLRDASQGTDAWTVAQILSVAAAIFTAINTFLQPLGISEKHRVARSRFEALGNEFSLLHDVRSYDQHERDAALSKECDSLVKRLNAAETESPSVGRLAQRLANRGDRSPESS